jgi:hypothetical protein
MLNLTRKHVQPEAESTSRRFLLRALRSFPSVPFFLTLAAGLLTQGQVLQTPAINPEDVDSGKVHPLDLAPGCWETRLETLDQIRTTKLELRPAEIPVLEKFMPPEQRSEFESLLKTLQARYQRIGKPGQDSAIFTGRSPTRR